MATLGWSRVRIFADYTNAMLHRADRRKRQEVLGRMSIEDLDSAEKTERDDDQTRDLNAFEVLSRLTPNLQTSSTAMIEFWQELCRTLEDGRHICLLWNLG